MANFEVHGAFEVDWERKKGGRALVFDRFWTEESDAYYLADSCGCYVFGIRTGGGITPIYIGKAAKSFKQETFNPSNRHKYHNGFSDYAKGSPVMFFVVHSKAKGPNNEKQIEEIEHFLIQAGVAKNPNIQNNKGKSKPQWSIKGVVRSKPGKKSHAETSFAKIFNIKSK